MSRTHRTDTAAAPRLYVPELAGAAGEVFLSEGEAHHAGSVLRLREGQPVELFDGRGHVAAGRIAVARRRDVRVSMTAAPRDVERTGPILHLAFAVPKGKRLDWLLEKATELGAASLTPVVFDRSVAGGESLTPAKRRRWESHCVAAAKQSGLNHLPGIARMRKLPAWLEELQGAAALMGDCAPGTRSLIEVLAQTGAGGEVRLLVGPEGGMTEDERRLAEDRGVRPARLGDTALRIETAAVALLAGVTALLPKGGET